MNCSPTARSGCGSTRLWQKGREAIIRAARNPDAALAGKLGEVLHSMGGTLEGDPRIRAAINQFARRAVAGLAASYGGSIVKLVSETVRGWDARTITARLEAAVGRDLQYIRINGTLVGGLVGVILHAPRPALTIRHCGLALALGLRLGCPPTRGNHMKFASPRRRHRLPPRRHSPKSPAEPVTIIHAGTLLAEPGKAPLRNASRHHPRKDDRGGPRRASPRSRVRASSIFENTHRAARPDRHAMST